MVALPSEFRASLENYSGPLDLLLYLIKKDEVSVFDIPIARVLEQYQVYLSVLSQLDPNACGDFLVMLAHLMEIKSKLLLPREILEDDVETEDPRMELVRQLLEYKKYKERALLLESRLDLHRRRFPRPGLELPLGGQDSPPLDLGAASVWDLFTAFHRIQLAIAMRGPVQVVLEDRRIEDYVAEVVAHLEQAPGRRAAFEALFERARTRREAIGYFLAILELAKEYRLVISQHQARGMIEVELRTDEEVRELEEAARRAVEAEAVSIEIGAVEGAVASESAPESGPADPAVEEDAEDDSDDPFLASLRRFAPPDSASGASSGTPSSEVDEGSTA